MRFILAAALILLSSCAGFSGCLDADGRLIKACEHKEKPFAPLTFYEGQ